MYQLVLIGVTNYTQIILSIFATCNIIIIIFFFCIFLFQYYKHIPKILNQSSKIFKKKQKTSGLVLSAL